jgi:hypothetical protein
MRLMTWLGRPLLRLLGRDDRGDRRAGGRAFCINGYFTQGLIPAVGAIGGTNLGASTAQLSG